MSEAIPSALRRDCDAVQIPSGGRCRLPVGTPFELTQSLGGSHTIRTPDGLYRVQEADADAVGLATGGPGASDPPPKAASAMTDDDLSEDAVWDILRTCYDPEIPVNVVDLGLIYSLQILPLGDSKRKIAVKMTLTAPGCGMGPVIAEDAQQRLLELPGVEEAEVEIVWDPPWHHSMISPAGRARLGLDE